MSTHSWDISPRHGVLSCRGAPDAPPGFAEVATDGTLGRGRTLRGGDIAIGAGLGQPRGGNLFHSFRKFDVETRARSP